MKNSYGIYTSEAEYVKAKIHSVSDMIEYLKAGSTSICNYAKPDVREVFKKILNDTCTNIKTDDIKSLIKIFVINNGLRNTNALLPIIDYYKCVSSRNSLNRPLWNNTSDSIIMLFRWIFPHLAAESVVKTDSMGMQQSFIDSFIKTIDVTMCKYTPEFGQINQNLYNFLKNEAADPLFCIKEYVRDMMNMFPDNNPQADTSCMQKLFLSDFRSTFGVRILPPVDGVQYSKSVLIELSKMIFETELHDKVSDVNLMDDTDCLISLIYPECISFIRYIENDNSSDEWKPTEYVPVTIADSLSSSEDWLSIQEKIRRVSMIIFDTINEYRGIPKESGYHFANNLSVACVMELNKLKDITYNVGTQSKVYTWDTIKDSIDKLQCFYEVEDEMINKEFKGPGAVTVKNAIGRISIVPATEASKYEKEGKGSTGKAAMVQGLEKTRRNIADATNTVKNGVYIPYKKYKNGEKAIDNQLAKITRGLKDAILNTNSAKYREEIIAGKTYSPISILKKVIVGYGVFCTSKVIFLIGLITRYYCGKNCKARERRKAINELEGEIKILDEKIQDAQAAGDNKAKYELMRTRNSLNSSRDAIISNFDKNPDKYKESARKALFNVEVNTNGKN